MVLAAIIYVKLARITNCLGRYFKCNIKEFIKIKGYGSMLFMVGTFCTDEFTQGSLANAKSTQPISMPKKIVILSSVSVSIYTRLFTSPQLKISAILYFQLLFSCIKFNFFTEYFSFKPYVLKKRKTNGFI